MHVLAKLLAVLLPMALAIPAAATIEPEPVDPARAIELAREHPHAGAEGRFRLRVAATGKVRFEQYLNSHPDYRDPTCLTVVLKRGAMRSLRKRFGDDPTAALMGKDIIVRGTVHRTRIWLLSDTDEHPYYYQTHVDVTSADQITVVE